jgi:hypothetical protein
MSTHETCPRPWVTLGLHDGTYTVEDAAGAVIAYDIQPEHAVVIVAAVNAHDALVTERDALRKALAWALHVVETAKAALPHKLFNDEGEALLGQAHALGKKEE